ncbi:MAG TPA: FecR family protein [Acetobacteraceae bacterium]|nr:FecR family protein [Acetobacteraceae bacterium]
MRRREVLLGTLTAATIAARGASAIEPAGNVETLRGEAFAEGAGARRSLAPAADVFVGDLVATGAASSVGLRLGPATLLRLGPEAQLRIERFLLNVGGILELARGGMLYNHDGSAGQSDVTVRTRFGLIAVRGTRFFAGPNNGTFGVFVMQGLVTVAGRNTSVNVPVGMGTDVTAPGAEPTNPHPWGAQRIERAMASIG